MFNHYSPECYFEAGEGGGGGRISVRKNIRVGYKYQMHVDINCTTTHIVNLIYDYFVFRY
jgi:hypothetical protein